jgi:hypothetical protein
MGIGAKRWNMVCYKRRFQTKGVRGTKGSSTKSARTLGYRIPVNSSRPLSNGTSLGLARVNWRSSIVMHSVILDGVGWLAERVPGKDGWNSGIKISPQFKFC